MAAVAGVPRVPTRVAQAAGTVICAARIIDQGCSNVRMSVFASGVNRVGDTKWMILHGSGMAGSPEVLRLERQLQNARRAHEGLVMAGASLECPPAAAIGGGVPVGESLSVALPSIVVPDTVVQLTPAPARSRRRRPWWPVAYLLPCRLHPVVELKQAPPRRLLLPPRTPLLTRSWTTFLVSRALTR
eukprot:TRINITY_DN338_c0_g1_i1.p2 TRINITY_DN338_c0_g1~~TRINITY_DN338_c0_g1_i1.p2  ORF type:complete len:187 (-),score=17.11 TRINITY_DN338_c0_g1_i1:267-827(-)